MNSQRKSISDPLFCATAFNTTKPEHERFKSLFAASIRHPRGQQFFKSIKSLRVENQRQFRTIHPFSVFQQYFVLITTPLDFVSIFIISFIFGFYTDEDTLPIVCIILLWIISTIRSAEIVVRLLTGYENESHNVELRLRYIFWNYFKSWLILDLVELVSLSLYHLFPNVSVFLFSLHVATRSMANLGTFAESLQLKDMKYRMLRLTLITMLCTHLLTCLESYYGVPVSRLLFHNFLICISKYIFDFRHHLRRPYIQQKWNHSRDTKQYWISYVGESLGTVLILLIPSLWQQCRNSIGCCWWLLDLFFTYSF